MAHFAASAQALELMLVREAASSMSRVIALPSARATDNNRTYSWYLMASSDWHAATALPSALRPSSRTGGAAPAQCFDATAPRSSRGHSETAASAASATAPPTVTWRSHVPGSTAAHDLAVRRRFRR